MLALQSSADWGYPSLVWNPDLTSMWPNSGKMSGMNLTKSNFISLCPRKTGRKWGLFILSQLCGLHIMTVRVVCLFLFRRGGGGNCLFLFERDGGEGGDGGQCWNPSSRLLHGATGIVFFLSLSLSLFSFFRFCFCFFVFVFFFSLAVCHSNIPLMPNRTWYLMGQEFVLKPFMLASFAWQVLRPLSHLHFPRFLPPLVLCGALCGPRLWFLWS